MNIYSSINNYIQPTEVSNYNQPFPLTTFNTDALIVPGSTWLRTAMVPILNRWSFASAWKPRSLGSLGRLSRLSWICVHKQPVAARATVPEVRGPLAEEELLSSEGQHLVPINSPTCQARPTFEDLIIFHLRFRRVTKSDTVIWRIWLVVRGAGGLMEPKNMIRHCGLITHARKEQFQSDERRYL